MDEVILVNKVEMEEMVESCKLLTEKLDEQKKLIKDLQMSKGELENKYRKILDENNELSFLKDSKRLDLRDVLNKMKTHM